MGGNVKFEDALAARLGLMKPSRQNIDSFLAAHPPRISPGVLLRSGRVTCAAKHEFLA